LDFKKIWPEKKWKRIIFVFLVVMVILSISVSVFLYLGINNDVVSEIIVANEQGTSNALLIYHPGFSTFTKDVSYGYAEGLELNDWRVEISTASGDAPSDISKYDLLILASPVYGGAPSPTIGRHVNRMGDLENTKTVIIVTAAGSPGNTAETLKTIVEENNGIINSKLVLFASAPNEGDESAVNLSRIAGAEVIP